MCLHPEGYQVYIGDEREKTVDEKYRITEYRTSSGDSGRMG